MKSTSAINIAAKMMSEANAWKAMKQILVQSGIREVDRYMALHVL